jgi:predicted Mrr-cat superfamily restriction endonuclease
MKKTTFADVLDAAGSLPVGEREELVELLHKRAMEERRAELCHDIKNARSDYKNRKYTVASADKIMKELLS